MILLDSHLGNMHSLQQESTSFTLPIRDYFLKMFQLVLSQTTLKNTRWRGEVRGMDIQDGWFFSMH